MERVTGIEPVRSAWEADRLPLHHTRTPRSAENRNKLTFQSLQSRSRGVVTLPPRCALMRTNAQPRNREKVAESRTNYCFGSDASPLVVRSIRLATAGAGASEFMATATMLWSAGE